MADGRSIPVSRSGVLDRRRVLSLARGVAGATSGSSPLPTQGQRVAVPRVAPPPEPPPRIPPARTNPALFWSDTALQLDTLDHSVRNEARRYLPIKYTQIDQMIEGNNKSRVHIGLHWNFDAVGCPHCRCSLS